MPGKTGKSADGLRMPGEIPEEIKQANRRNRLRNSLFVILILAIAVAGNLLVNTCVSRFNLKADMTSGQIFVLTEDTKQILDDLTEQVTITYLNDETNADDNIAEILKRYKSYSDQVKVEYLNLESNPSVASDFEERGYTLSSDGIIVEAGDSQPVVIKWSELYGYNSYTDGSGNTAYNMTSLKAEQKITSAIVQTTTTGIPVVAMTQGHGEANSEELTELIGVNYRTDTFIPGVDQIPEGTTTILINGAQRDFSESEIKAVSEFMTAGGNLIVYRDPEIRELPNLDRYLEEWGLKIKEELVLEPGQQMDSPLNVIPNFSQHMINVWFSDHSSYVVLPKVRSLEIESVNGKLVSPVFTSTKSAYGKNVEEMSGLLQTEADPTGSFTLAATSEYSQTDADGTEKTSYVFLMGCTDFCSDTWLKNTSIGNRELVLQTLSVMNDHTVTLDIPEKSLSKTKIAISWSSTVTVAVIYMAVIPLLLILRGMYIYLKRRHS